MQNVKIKQEYTKFLMMRDRLRGMTIKEIASTWGVTPSSASRYVNAVASECMRIAMAQTQGDPEHPSTPRFTVEDFTNDPRAAMVAIMEEQITKLEKNYPDVKK